MVPVTFLFSSTLCAVAIFSLLCLSLPLPQSHPSNKYTYFPMSTLFNFIAGVPSDAEIPCIVTITLVFDGETKYDSFPIEIHSSKTVGHLKQLIKEANPNTLRDVDARKLRIWRIVDLNPWSKYFSSEEPIEISKINNTRLLDTVEKIEDVFSQYDGPTIDFVVQYGTWEGGFFLGRSLAMIILSSLFDLHSYFFFFYSIIIKHSRWPKRGLLLLFIIAMILSFSTNRTSHSTNNQPSIHEPKNSNEDQCLLETVQVSILVFRRVRYQSYNKARYKLVVHFWTVRKNEHDMHSYEVCEKSME